VSSVSSAIVELKSREELAEAHEVMSELRTHLSETEYLGLLEDMMPLGYRLFAVREDSKIAALAGIGMGVNLYYGRYLWVYDLVTTESHRSKGHGKALLDHLEELARAEGCDTIALASGLQRIDAHRFYEEKAGFELRSYTFVKDLR
jgi:GNAT superfamily N-acetyltransferase